MANRILNISDYPNLLDKIKISSAEVSNNIEKYSLVFYQNRDKTVEWYSSFPTFLVPFYKYMVSENLIPTQQTFFDYYLSENSGYFKDNKLSPELLYGLKARIFRTYPSLVRDVHFALYLKEQIHERVVYNINMDVMEGIDILIIGRGKIWGVNLYANTKRSLNSRIIKSHRHEKFTNVNYVELPTDFKGTQICGSFFLYGLTELTLLIEIIGGT